MVINSPQTVLDFGKFWGDKCIFSFRDRYSENCPCPSRAHSYSQFPYTNIPIFNGDSRQLNSHLISKYPNRSHRTVNHPPVQTPPTECINDTIVSLSWPHSNYSRVKFNETQLVNWIPQHRNLLEWKKLQLFQLPFPFNLKRTHIFICLKLCF